VKLEQYVNNSFEDVVVADFSVVGSWKEAKNGETVIPQFTFRRSFSNFLRRSMPLSVSK
jgi:hypothetical protein